MKKINVQMLPLRKNGKINFREAIFKNQLSFICKCTSGEPMKYGFKGHLHSGMLNNKSTMIVEVKRESKETDKDFTYNVYYIYKAYKN